MADGLKAVYWDSCVIISRIQRTPERIEVLEYLTEEAERNRLLIVVSTFTIIEVNRTENQKPLTEEEDRLISDYFENDYIVIRPLTIPIARLARDIAREYRIKPKDAVHVATAVFWEVPLLHSYDENLCKKTEMIGDPPLKIENPSFIDLPPFFAIPGVSVPQPDLIELATASGDIAATDPPSVRQAEANQEGGDPIIVIAGTEVASPSEDTDEGYRKFLDLELQAKPPAEPDTK
jgi:predicted nucleic acid-binding protein